jgi:hypothetical protein
MPAKSRHRLKLAAAPLCAIALAATGCGGGSSYKDDLNTANNEFNKAFKSANAKIRTGRTEREYTQGFTESKSAVQTLEGKLRTLKPPAKARTAQAQLLGALDAISRDLDSLLQSLKSGNVENVRTFLTKYLRDLQALQVAGKRLKARAS